MSSGELDNLVRIGLLKTEPRDQKEFEALVDAGRTYLADAHAGKVSFRTQFNIAYDAAHAFALAALRWHGYRPNRTRFVVFQTLQHTLGLKPEIWRILATCHERRNEIEYEGSFMVEEQLLVDLFAATDQLREK